MPHCDTCGSAVVDTARFCTSCGARLLGRGIEQVAVGQLLSLDALRRFSRCVDALASVTERDQVLAVAQAWAAGVEGLLALTVDELLFVDERDAEVTSEPLADVRTCFVDPDTGSEIVITLDDGSALGFTVRGSRADTEWFASAIWSAASPPPPAVAVPSGAAPTPRARLAMLKELHDEGLITAEDYERRRAILEDV